MKLQPLIVAAAACLASLCSAAATDQKAPPAGPKWEMDIAALSPLCRDV